MQSLMQKVFDNCSKCLFSAEADVSMPMRIAAPSSQFAFVPYIKLADQLEKKMAQQDCTIMSLEQHHSAAQAMQRDVDALRSVHERKMRELTNVNARLQEECGSLAQQVCAIAGQCSPAVMSVLSRVSAQYSWQPDPKGNSTACIPPDNHTKATDRSLPASADAQASEGAASSSAAKAAQLPLAGQESQHG